MQVSSASPLTATSFVWQSGAGASILTILVKATCALRPGRCPILATPDALLATDLYFSASAPGSIRAPADFAPFKRRVDVLLTGHAHAASGATVRSLVARLAVGTLDKSIAVHGDRSWLPNGKLTRALPFFKMPLRWERAGGGPSTSNPVGRPTPTAEDGTVAAPNLVPVGFELVRREQTIQPIGFAPLAPYWPTRRALLGLYEPSFLHPTWHERPLPADLEPGYFNAAPRDQQLDALVDPLEILLENLHPERSRFTAVIEDLRPRARVTRSGAAPQEIWPRCDTVLIDTDRGVCSLTWRVSLPLSHAREEVHVVVSPTRAQAPLSPEVPSAPARADLAGASRPRKPALTFASDDEVTAPVAMVRPVASRTLPFPKNEDLTAVGPTARPDASSALPFRADAPDAPAVTAPSVVREEPATASSKPRGLGWLRGPLVLGAPAPRPAVVDREDTFVGAAPPRKPRTLPFVGRSALTSASVLARLKPAPSAEIEDPSTLAPTDTASTSLGLPFPSTSSPAVPIADDEPEPTTERHPILLASLAAPAAPLFQLAPTLAPVPTATAAPVAPPAPRATAVLSVERYARIKAELWGCAGLGAVLERHGIDEVEWLVHERRQASLLAGEAREGRCDLALALVAAFETARAASREPAALAP